MADKSSAQRTASGLEGLIARLRDEGVAAGRSEAERILAEADATAHKLVEKAEAMAKAKIEAAQKESESLRRAGEEALRAAMRDTVLNLKDQLTRRFTDDVAKMVSEKMCDGEMLKRMILAIVGRAREESGVDQVKDVEVILPRKVVGLDELRRKPEELREGSLSHFAAAMAAEMLRAGVNFSRSENDENGIRLVLAERGISVDLTDRAVAEAILVHLQPRFRALLEGVVK
jgi:V/A-type H+-transporting ATPase subunit E